MQSYAFLNKIDEIKDNSIYFWQSEHFLFYFSKTDKGTSIFVLKKIISEIASIYPN
jgi:hypothetical protein